MEKLGFKLLDSNICLFKHQELDILVVLYIDDLLVVASNVDLINYTRDGLKRVYDLKELGKVKRFLGFDILYDRQARKIFISQETYIKVLLAKRGIDNYSPITTP
jgi:hypothetical protein